MKRIPKIIHRTWVGPYRKPIKLMKTWEDRHPNYKFCEWNNETVKNFPWRLQKQLNQMWGAERWHGVADIVRWEILWHFGGFFAPADSECLNPIDDLLKLGCFCCYENEKHNSELLSPHIGVYPHNKLIKLIIDGLAELDDVLFTEPWRVTGNQKLTSAVKWSGLPIVKLPSYTFIPEHYKGYKYKGSGKVYARHLWGTTKKIHINLDNQIK